MTTAPDDAAPADADPDAAAEPELVVEDRGPARWLRLNRPAKRNAMTRGMAETLRAELARAGDDDGVAALVIVGAGTAFSSGADRRDALEGPAASLQEKRRTPLWPVDELWRFPKPVVAALNGPAHGGGATLAMACDLRIASDEASLTFNLATVGLTPEFGSSYLLWRQVGYATALELFLTGRTIAANEAHGLRLVNRVVTPASLESEVQVLVEHFAALPPGTTAAVKNVLRAGLDATFDEARRVELQSLATRAAERRDPS